MNVHSFRDLTMLGKRGFPYDSFELYADGAAVNGLNGGLLWSASYVDRNSPLGIFDSDDFESYTDAAVGNGLNGGNKGWLVGYVDRDGLFGIKSSDDFEAYADAVDVAGLNYGTGWTGVWMVGQLPNPAFSTTYLVTDPCDVTITVPGITSPTIYYTTNGSTPTTSSTLYTAPVSVTNGTVLKALAVKSGYTNSGVQSCTYAPLDTDVADWVTRVAGLSGTISGSDIAAANDFMLGLKADGLFTLAYRIGIYPPGGNLNALKAPFIKAAGASVDTLTGFVSGDLSANGLIGGAGKWIQTGFNPAVSATAGDFSVGVYRRTAGNNGVIDIGCYNGSQYLYLLNNPPFYFSCWYNFSQINTTPASYVGLFMGNRNSTTITLYRNGSSIVSGTDTATVIPSFEIYVHAANGSGSGASPTTSQFCFYWIGKALTALQHTNLNLRVQALQTAWTRNV